MKTLNNKTLLMLLLTLTLGFSSYAQKSFTKEYNKTFDASKISKLIIENQYGDVDIKNRNSNAIEIKVIIVAETNEKKAKAAFEKIKIKFDKNGSTASAITSFESAIKNTNFKINYSVTMPENIKLDLKNKYGSIFINKLTSASKIYCKYGKYKINEISTERNETNTIFIKYSSGNIDKCGNADIEIKYSDLELRKGKDILIKSGYSKIDLGVVSTIKGTSKYDKIFYIDRASIVDIEGKYSKYKINTLEDALTATVKYSNITISNVLKNFSKIDIETKYGNTKIIVDKSASYKLEGEVKYGNLKYPGKTKSLDSYETGNDFIGSNKNTKSKIKIFGKYGNIKIK